MQRSTRYPFFSRISVSVCFSLLMLAGLGTLRAQYTLTLTSIGGIVVVIEDVPLRVSLDDTHPAIRVYPNPIQGNGILTVESTHDIAEVWVINGNNQPVARTVGRGTSVPLQLPGLQPGLYRVITLIGTQAYGHIIVVQ
ncbi:MAG: hypothetical protein NW241_04590 [Bacteroidia bacterium]|nr:hypothetical protein [Bacteroidia bacterium]